MNKRYFVLRTVRNLSSRSKYNPWPQFDFTGSIRPFPPSRKLDINPEIPVPDYAKHISGFSQDEFRYKILNYIPVLRLQEIVAMRRVCHYVREIFDYLEKFIRPGVTGDEINYIVHSEAVKRNCYPSPLNYQGFPRSCCISTNEILCHGIPDTRPLENGDVVSVDISLYCCGFHGDACETYIIGRPSPSDTKLLKVAMECLLNAIKIVKPGTKFSEIGCLIEEHANRHGFDVIPIFTGHGIHRAFHVPPAIFHHHNDIDEGIMTPGNVFTIEPIVTSGTTEPVFWPDGWTAASKNGQKSAQFEHTILVTENGLEILTASESTFKGLNERSQTNPHSTQE